MHCSDPTREQWMFQVGRSVCRSRFEYACVGIIRDAELIAFEWMDVAFGRCARIRGQNRRSTDTATTEYGETVATVLELHEAPVPLIVPTVLGLHSDKHI